MKNSTYWRKRFQQLEDAQNKKGMKAYRQIEAQYRQAQREIEAKIAVWYQRLAENNNVSLASAKKMLTGSQLQEFQWDVWEYIKHGKENAINQSWVKELENASAKFHISRLEALKIQIRQSLELMHAQQLGTVTEAMTDIFRSSYYHTAYELQKGLRIGWDIAGLDQAQIEKVISKPWAVDGKNFSTRIWGNKEKLITELHKELTQNLILGDDPQRVIDRIAKKMNTSKQNAGRLVMTEEAYFSSVAQKDCFYDLGVEKYEIVATLDSHTSEICQNMDGQVFLMKDYEAGVTAPPFHVYCRSVTAPYFEDNFEQIGERSARGEDGKVYYVPGDMGYQEWYDIFTGGGDKSGLDAVYDGSIHHFKRLQDSPNDDTIKKKPEVKELNKLKQSGMAETEYQEFLNMINSHGNEDVIRLYGEYADKINKVSLTSSQGAAYTPGSNSLTFNFNNSVKYPDMNKYGTLAHEYGHFFDCKAGFCGLNFKEMEAVRKATGLDTIFKNAVSSSDEFLAAMRKDKLHIKGILTDEAKADLITHNASSGVQDAIDGLFVKSRLRWGHGEKYYNRKYASVDYMDKMLKGSLKKKLQQAYNDLGLDAGNLSKTKSICRQYEAASEAWANIMSAEVCGGESLEYVKKYLPNSYQAMLDILKGVKANE